MLRKKSCYFCEFVKTLVSEPLLLAEIAKVALTMRRASSTTGWWSWPGDEHHSVATCCRKEESAKAGWPKAAFWTWAMSWDSIFFPSGQNFIWNFLLVIVGEQWVYFLCIRSQYEVKFQHGKNVLVVQNFIFIFWTGALLYYLIPVFIYFLQKWSQADHGCVTSTQTRTPSWGELIVILKKSTDYIDKALIYFTQAGLLTHFLNQSVFPNQMKWPANTNNGVWWHQQLLSWDCDSGGCSYSCPFSQW